LLPVRAIFFYKKTLNNNGFVSQEGKNRQRKSETKNAIIHLVAPTALPDYKKLGSLFNTNKTKSDPSFDTAFQSNSMPFILYDMLIQKSNLRDQSISDVCGTKNKKHYRAIISLSCYRIVADCAQL
jgi:hypothetical protein